MIAADILSVSFQSRMTHLPRRNGGGGMTSRQTTHVDQRWQSQGGIYEPANIQID